MPPIQREGRSALSSLLQVMNKNPRSLESLETLTICSAQSEQQASGLFAGLSMLATGLFGALDGNHSEADLKRIFDEIGERAHARRVEACGAHARRVEACGAHVRRVEACGAHARRVEACVMACALACVLA